MQSRFTQCLLAFLATFASFVRADYYIDDQNITSLLYSENPGVAKWGPFQEGGETLSISLANGTMIIDASHCYNYTYTFAACTVADNCQVEIPFSGSGIIIYVLQAGTQGINASLTISGGAPTYKVLDAPPGPNYYVPNVTLFSVQGMITADHTATMTVLNWNNMVGGIMFDYVLVNQTIISSPTTSTGSGGLASPTALATTIPETTATSTIPGVLPLNVGAIVGGVLGGLTALILIILAILYIRRCHRKVHDPGASDHVEPMIEPFVSTTQRPPPPVRYTTVSGHTKGESTVTSPVSAQAPTQWTSSRSPPLDKSLLSFTNPSTSRFAGPSILPPVQDTPSSTASETSHVRIEQSHPTLTDDQASFVNHLYANNVPATAVARVIERMMAGERHPAVDGYDSLSPPPSYYHSTNNR